MGGGGGGAGGDSKTRFKSVLRRKVMDLPTHHRRVHIYANGRCGPHCVWENRKWPTSVFFIISDKTEAGLCAFDTFSFS